MDRDEIRKLTRAVLQAKINGDKAAEKAARVALAPVTEEMGKRIKAMTARTIAGARNDNS